MLRIGQQEADKEHLSNMVFVKGYAEELPFLDNSFDIVFSRLAFHHFTDVTAVFSEMVTKGAIIHHSKVGALRSPKAPRRRAVICASNEPNEYACIFTRRMPQQPTECWLPQSWSAPNHTGDATPSPLRFGRCRANVHWTFCTPALAAASYPFVNLPSGDTLRCKLFPADKFYKICYLFDRQ